MSAKNVAKWLMVFLSEKAIIYTEAFWVQNEVVGTTQGNVDMNCS